ncbi:amidohydrolase family protein [Candidatus Bipolaricaulota bacterium]|nr:amidohydrolase family protein [Candidatus Bipolaricaulota bacterium]
MKPRLLVFALGLLGLCSMLAVGDDMASLILFNGTVIPMTAEGDAYEAIAIRGNRILAVGQDANLTALAGPNTQFIDLQGAVVYPGFIDAHTHLLNDSWNAGISPIDSQALALRYGITMAANMYTTSELLADYLQMAQQGDMRVRFSLYLVYNTSCGDTLGHWYADQAPLREIAPRLSIGGIKIFAETSVCGDDLIGISFTPELRPALSPAGTEWYGNHRPLFSQSELADVIRTVSQWGFPVAIHAIGDGGVQLSLDAIEQALDGRVNALRHTILHNLFIRDDLLSRYADLGIVAAVESMTPCFVTFYRDLLLPEDLKPIVRRWGDLMATDAHVTADSDWPWCAEEAINPLFRLQALMSPINHSQSYSAWEPCGLLPHDQLLTAWQGLRSMTAEAAFMLHREEEVGTLEVGKLADLVVLSADPLRTDVESLTDIDVLLTMVDGIIEYDSQMLDD